MAEVNGQEKTEQPTSKRRRDARRDGNVFQSKDVVTVVLVFGVFYMIKLWLPYMYRTTRACMIYFFTLISEPEPLNTSPNIYLYVVFAIIKCAMPLLLISAFLGFMAHGIQTKFNFTWKPLHIKFNKLNPISGIKRLFNPKKLVDVVKNLIKISLLLAFLVNIVRSDIVQVSRMIDMDTFLSATETLRLVFDLVRRVCIAFTVVAFFDYIYQKWDYGNNLKMTKQEVKEEYKNSEGNPEIKGRIRKVQRQMALMRMMQNVPKADVIIRNPTHFAVALKYDPDKNGAPVVVAKGQDNIALRIVRIGEENGVFIIENKPLARALYGACELEREIPPEFYSAVAEILVYIYRASNREEMFR